MLKSLTSLFVHICADCVIERISATLSMFDEDMNDVMKLGGTVFLDTPDY